MARPRVLVSSTCNDLYVIREQLRSVIDNMGYEAVLSEEGDVYYSPDLHVHLSCIREVRNCDMVVLIIGNRFGSELATAPKKSVTQAEHDTAYLSSIPIFAFIDQRVLTDYATYRRAVDAANRAKRNPDVEVSAIPFGSRTDVRVFKFIDDLRAKVTNNGYFPYSNFEDIKDALKKQWAGMLYDFLKQRTNESKDRAVLDLLGRLEIASSKVEQVVELIANSTVPANKKQTLSVIDLQTNEKRITIIFQSIWNGFYLNPAALSKAHSLTKRQLDRLYDTLMSDRPVRKAADEFQKIIQELTLAAPNSWYMDISVKFRVEELRHSVKRLKIPRATALKAFKETLLQSLAAAKEKSEKESRS